VPQRSEPTYCRQRVKNAPDRAFVVLDGRRRYLGRFDTPQSRERYHRILAEWNAAGGKLPPSLRRERVTVADLIDRYQRAAEARYRKPTGEPTSQVGDVAQALKHVRRLYAHADAADFGPLALRAVRHAMIKQGWARKTINSRIGIVRRMFRWAVAEELVEPSIYDALRAVADLERARSDAPETEPVRPVPEAWIAAVEPHVSRQVWALVQFQLHTGARPGEVVIARPTDFDMSGEVWTYTPADHKGAYRGIERTIYVGPRAQAAVEPFLAGRPLDAFLFSPTEAERERRAAQRAARRTPLSCGNRPGTNRTDAPARCAGDRYTRDSYRRAIHRGCDLAFPPQGRLARRDGETEPDWRRRLDAAGLADELAAWRRDHRWAPNRLRHNAATRLRREYGIDVAQTILGHRLGSSITEVYAEGNVGRALEVMRRVG